MKKHDEFENPGSCLNKAQDDEPIFVLRANDPLAPMVVRLWADAAHVMGISKVKVHEAQMLSLQMEEWFTSKKNSALEGLRKRNSEKEVFQKTNEICFGWDVFKEVYLLEYSREREASWKIYREKLKYDSTCIAEAERRCKEIVNNFKGEPINEGTFYDLKAAITDIFKKCLPPETWSRV